MKLRTDGPNYNGVIGSGALIKAYKKRTDFTHFVFMS